tara:strand:- start:4378 stop:4941 length:564 start_codon:yes stop_codon:yes gene_type:complete
MSKKYTRKRNKRVQKKTKNGGGFFFNRKKKDTNPNPKPNYRKELIDYGSNITPKSPYKPPSPAYAPTAGKIEFNVNGVRGTTLKRLKNDKIVEDFKCSRKGFKNEYVCSSGIKNLIANQKNKNKIELSQKNNSFLWTCENKDGSSKYSCRDSSKDGKYNKIRKDKEKNNNIDMEWQKALNDPDAYVN